jgi:hypothetical protein
MGQKFINAGAKFKFSSAYTAQRRSAKYLLKNTVKSTKPAKGYAHTA